MLLTTGLKTILFPTTQKALFLKNISDCLKKQGIERHEELLPAVICYNLDKTNLIAYWFLVVLLYNF